MTTNRKARTRALAIAPLLLAAGLATSCAGGDPGDGQVAQGTAKPAASQAAAGDPFQRGLQYAKCMRDHGVKNFPDPQRGPGGKGVSMKMDKKIADSPNFASAQQACRSLQPGGSSDTGGGKVDGTKIGPWAACIRSHGVPNFPDPKNKGGALEIDFTGTGINPQSPAFQKAQQACKSKAPGGGLLVKGGRP